MANESVPLQEDLLAEVLFHHSAASLYALCTEKPIENQPLPLLPTDTDIPIWAPLDPNREEIRLMYVHPVSVALQPVVIDIKVVSLLENIPDYFAISYAWEDRANSCPIVVNGRVIGINPNLDAAIRAFRNRNEIAILWADAICINQDDFDEKNGQILLMQKIYKLAYNVLVWLGPADFKDTATVFEIIRNLDAGGDFFEGSLDDGTTSFSHMSKLSTVLSKSWFTRTWVIQEVTLGKAPMLCCGGQFISLIQLYNASRTMVLQYNKQCYAPDSLRRYSHECLVEGGHELRKIGNVMGVFHSTRYYWSTLQEKSNQAQPLLYDKVNHGIALSSFFDVLVKCRQQQSSDPRDKIYALLALLPTKTSTLIKPDYTKSIQRVYVDFAAILVSFGLLESILNQSGLKQARLRGLPSWVPDWSYSEGDLWCALLQHRLSGPFTTVLTGLTKTIPRPMLYSDSVLVTYGVVLDSLHEIDMRDHDAFMNAVELHSRLVDFLVDTNHLYTVHAPYVLGKTIAEALLRVLLRDTEASEDDYNHGPRANKSTAMQLARALITIGLEDPPLKAITADLADGRMVADIEAPVTGQDASLLNWVTSCCKKMRLAISDASCLALVPQDARTGDQICLLTECSRPILLRQVDGKDKSNRQYQVVGECYVHGMMDLNARPSPTGTDADFGHVEKTSTHPKTSQVIHKWRHTKWKSIHLV